MSSETAAKDIPSINRKEPSASIPINYSTTPAGTVYSCTPGGSRIIYDRDTLLRLAKSPLAKTPPSKLAFVPGVTIVNNDTQNGQGFLAPPQLFQGPPQLLPSQQQPDEIDCDDNQQSLNTDENHDTHEEQQKDQQNDHHMFELEME